MTVRIMGLRADRAPGRGLPPMIAPTPGERVLTQHAQCGRPHRPVPRRPHRRLCVAAVAWLGTLILAPRPFEANLRRPREHGVVGGRLPARRIVSALWFRLLCSVSATARFAVIDEPIEGFSEDVVRCVTPTVMDALTAGVVAEHPVLIGPPELDAPCGIADFRPKRPSDGCGPGRNREALAGESRVHSRMRQP